MRASAVRASAVPQRCLAGRGRELRRLRMRRTNRVRNRLGGSGGGGAVGGPICRLEVAGDSDSERVRVRIFERSLVAH